MGNTMPGHPYLECKNHASKGIKPQSNMSGGGMMGSFDGKSMRPGGGGRFAKMVASGKSPALAAFIGRKKYGAKKMSSWSAKGKEK